MIYMYAHGDDFWHGVYYVSGEVGDYKIVMKDNSSGRFETAYTFTYRDMRVYVVLDDGTEVLLN